MDENGEKVDIKMENFRISLILNPQIFFRRRRRRRRRREKREEQER